MKERAKKLNKKAVIRLVVMALLGVVAIYSAVTLISNYADISRLKNSAAMVNAQYEKQIDDNEKVRAILNSKNKDEYIEQKAREKGYAKEGEIVFYNISSSK